MDTINKRSREIFTVTGDWAKQSAQLKEKYSQLTDADLKFEAGKEQDLLSRLQLRLGKKRDEVKDLLKRGQVITVSKG